MTESSGRRSRGHREQQDWRSELKRRQAASKGSFALGGLPRRQKADHVMPSMPVFNLPPIEDEPK